MTAPVEGEKRWVTRAKLYQVNHACVWCRHPTVLPEVVASKTKAIATLEHVQPLVKGGGNDCDNLAIACRSCNWSRGSMDRDVFSRLINDDCKEWAAMSPNARPSLFRWAMVNLGTARTAELGIRDTDLWWWTRRNRRSQGVRMEPA